MPSQLDSWVSNPGETHGPLMSITTWSLWGIAGAFLIPRLYIRHDQGKLWLDDLALGISWVLLLVQCILNQLGINLGFGKHALDINFSNFERITYYGAAALTVSITGIILSKISFGITLLRLTKGWLRVYVYFAIATLAIFAIPVAVLPWVLCKPITKTFVDIFPGTCINKEPSVQYGRFQAVWAAVMDFSLALLPWKILWNLQMRFAEKIGAGIAMSLGILAGATAILRARYVEQLQHQDLSYEAYNSVIWSVAETSMTIVATSIPVLRVFFKQAVNTAIESYHNSTGRSKSKSNGSSDPASTLGQGSERQLSKKPTDTTLNSSKESLVNILGTLGSKSDVEMDDLVVDETTDRVTALTPESSSRVPEGSNSEWPLRLRPWSVSV